jgi:Apea-like HEPN
VEWEIWTPDGETEIEQPRIGEFRLDANGAVTLRRFLAELAPLLTVALSASASKKAVTRLRRCAEHFLIAGEHAHGEGEVLSERNADAVLHYVIALEGLLAGDDPDRADFTRKVSQRAAVLAGENDAQRLDIEQLVRDAYRARSIYAHGSEPRNVDLPKLRRVVRRCILTRLILGDPASGDPLHKLADRALLSHAELDSRIRRPFSEFTQRVHTG